MRPRFQISLTGSLVVILIAALGFAAFSAKSAASKPDTPGPAVLPETLDARVAAAAFASTLEMEIVPETTVPQVTAVAEEAAPTPTPDPVQTTTSSTSTTTTTSTTLPRSTTTTTTTTTTPPTTTTTTTTTTAPPPTTTTTTTTAPPTTTTTAPPTTTTTVPPVEGGPRDVEEWRPLVSQYFPEERVDEALAVIKCESLGDPLAYNAASGASGLFQFIPGTWAWASPNAGFSGASAFEPEANIGTAAWLVQRSVDRGEDPWSHWSCKP